MLYLIIDFYNIYYLSNYNIIKLLLSDFQNPIMAAVTANQMMTRFAALRAATVPSVAVAQVAVAPSSSQVKAKKKKYLLLR